jgi:hypothetical protein
MSEQRVSWERNITGVSLAIGTAIGALIGIAMDSLAGCTHTGCLGCSFCSRLLSDMEFSSTDGRRILYFGSSECDDLTRLNFGGPEA